MQQNKKTIFNLSLYVFGILLLSIGSNLSICSNLGVSPVNSIPYVLSIITGIELGLLVPLVHSVVVFFQALVLKKEFKLFYCFEIIFVIIFGFFIKSTGFLVLLITPTNLFSQVTIMIISIFFIALGVSFYVHANILNLPVEAFAIALNQKFKDTPFHTFKLFIDCSFVAIAIVLGLVYRDSIIGVGVGTIFSAIFVSRAIPYTNKIAKPIFLIF